MTRPSSAMRREVVVRAGNRCEYCLIHQDDAGARHQVDHVIAEKHGGSTTVENLALSCLPCNRRKGSDIAANDPQTGQLTRLFNPRRQSWADHFHVLGARIDGITTEGRTTVEFFATELAGQGFGTHCAASRLKNFTCSVTSVAAFGRESRDQED